LSGAFFYDPESGFFRHFPKSPLLRSVPETGHGVGVGVAATSTIVIVLMISPGLVAVVGSLGDNPLTTFIPAITRPKTVWHELIAQSFALPSMVYPSREGIGMDVMKNWLPFVPLPSRTPAFAMETAPGVSCLRNGLTSLSNV